MKSINLPLTKDSIRRLKKNDIVYLNGPMLTARDAAHKRLFEALKSNKKIPISIKGETIYYTGPTPAKKGAIIGSCGPTTSARMDNFTPILLKHGLLGMIGKGERIDSLNYLIKKYKAIYFMTIGGAGAYLSKHVKKCNIVAYKDLGTEAIYRLIVKDFPVIVSIK